MKTISDTLLDLQGRISRKPTAKATFRRQILAFDSFTTVSNPWGYQDAGLIGGEPYVWGDVILTSGGYIFRFWSDGTITRYMSTNAPATAGNWAWVDPSVVVAAPGYANAGLYETGGTVYVFHLTADAQLSYRTCTEAGGSWSAEVAAGTQVYANGSCVSPVSQNEVFVCGADGGRISIWRAYNSGGWTAQECPYHFHGNTTWAVSGTELGSVSRFDAVSFNGAVHMFITLNDPGEIWTLRYEDGLWSEPEKLYGDTYHLMRAYRVSQVGDALWLTCRITRTQPEPLVDQEWDAVMISKDGWNWELNRYQYVNQQEIRGKFILKDGYVWYPGIETVFRSPSTNLIDSNDPTTMKTEVTDEIGAFSVNRAADGVADSVSISLADGDGAMSADDNVVPGAELVIEAGYSGNHTQLATAHVDNIDRVVADAVRTLMLSCRDLAFAKLRSFISPFYYPMLSQDRRWDDCDEMDNLYMINGGLFEADPANDRIGYTSMSHDGILLSASPPEARDCMIKAEFETTVDVAQTASSFGIVMCYADNSNYVLARVKTGSTDNITLEKVVNNTSTTLATASLAVTWNSKYVVAAEYRGGRIRVWVRGSTQSDFGDPLITYDWDEATTPIPTADGLGKFGVYCRIHTLQAGILGFGYSSDVVPADTDDLQDFASFPASGTLMIDEEKIAYTGKTGTSLALGSLICDGVGPFRDYDNPGGSSEGNETYDFDGEYGVQIEGDGTVYAADYFNNYAIASVSYGDTTSRYWAAKIAGYVPEAPDTWVADVDGGSAHVGDTAFGHWADRAARRFITDISTYGSLVDGDEVRVAPAFYGLTRGYDGTFSGSHSEGSSIAQWVSGEIRISGVWVMDMEPDKSVEWMLQRIAAIAGVHDFSFRSLYLSASLAVTGGGSGAWDDDGTWLSGVEQRDFELRFEMPTIGDSEKLGIAMRASSEDWDSYTGPSIWIEGVSPGGMSVALVDGGKLGTTLEKVKVQKPGTGVRVRLVSQGEFFSLYFNDRWIWTWHTTSFQGTATNYLGFSFYGGASISLSNVRVPELGERREAAQVDVNSDCISAIGSVLEDRPVEIITTSEGGMLASYFSTRDDASSVLPDSCLKNEVFGERLSPSNADCFSAVQVYCEDVVEIVDHALAKQYGFVFRPIQASTLSVADGYKEAQRLLKRIKEEMEQRSLSCRAMLHIERGDELDVDYTTISGEQVQETVIVNDISLDFQPARFEMAIGARKKST